MNKNADHHKILLKTKQVCVPLLAASISLSTGCSLKELKGTIKFEPTRAITLEEGKTLQFNYTNKKNESYFRKKYDEAADGDKKRVRNEIIDDLKGLINQNFRDYEVGLRTGKNFKDLIATLSSMGLTAAATVTGGQTTKAILSAIATGVIGANAAFDKEFFKDTTIEVILLEMENVRAQQEKLINDGKGKSVTDYTLNQAIDDLVEYYNAGFVTRALTSLAAKAGLEAQSSKNDANKARK